MSLKLIQLPNFLSKLVPYTSRFISFTYHTYWVTYTYHTCYALKSSGWIIGPVIYIYTLCTSHKLALATFKQPAQEIFYRASRPGGQLGGRPVATWADFKSPKTDCFYSCSFLCFVYVNPNLHNAQTPSAKPSKNSISINFLCKLR